MSNDIVLAIEQTCFIVPEVTKGVAVFPSSAAEMVVGAGTIDLNQQPTYSNSEEIVNSLDVMDRFMDQIAEGNFSIPTYIRPSGSAGSVPMSATLLESLMGVETVTGSTSVAYTQATTKPSFTIWVKKGDIVRFGVGGCVDKASLNFTNKGGASIDFSGGFMQMGFAGVSAVSGAVSADTAVVVTNAKLFTAGAYVMLASDDNSGAGYKIDSVNVATNTLTMVDAVTVADAAVIKGFLPTYTAIGTALENRETSITLSGSARTLKSLSLDISSPVQFQTDEITTSGYAEEYVEDTRAITGKITILERTDDLAFYTDGLGDDDTPIVITVGTEAGSIFTLNLPYARLDVPTETTNKPTLSLDIGVTALGSAGEDSCSILFT